MKKLTLDMDGVMADTHKKLVSVILNDFNTSFTEEELNQNSLKEILHPKQYRKLQKIIDTPGFFSDIEVMKDAQDVVEHLTKYYDIFVATACMEYPTSFQDKFNWLKKHFGFIPWTHIVFCGYKSIIHADYLIDDHIRNLQAFEGQGILFSAPHNTGNHQFSRVNDWKDISEVFLPIT